MGCSSTSTRNDNYSAKKVESLNMTIPNFSAKINNVDSKEKISQMNPVKKNNNFLEKINETQNKDYPLKSTDNCIIKVSRSICKITIREENETQFGTGFLLKLNTDDNNQIYCLISCEHVISRNLIEKQCTMDIEYDTSYKRIEIVLDKSKRTIITFDDIIDLTLVEIIKDDNINEDYFLSPNYQYIKNFRKDTIYIPQYPYGAKNLTHSESEILETTNYELSYYASTDGGSSGSPIFLKGTIEVIGIHKAGEIPKLDKNNKQLNKNFGDLIEPILNIYKNNREKIYFVSCDYYVGEWKNGKKNGKGKLYYKNGNILYDGDFINDKFEGNGKYRYENSEYYIKEWLNWNEFDTEKKFKRHGKGKLYDADFIDLKSKKEERLLYEDGNYYEGEWKNGKKNGKGKLYYKNSDLLYDGDFLDDKFEGNGKYNNKNNHDKFDEGKRYYENGGYYIGEFVNGLRHGKGILYNSEGKIIYKGDFKNDKFDGYGKYIFKNGNVYEGECTKGYLMGKGTLYYKDGSKKSGDFIKVYKDNGNCYIGDFKDGLRNGKGKLYNSDGKKKYEGNFVNDKYDGYGKLYKSDGSYYEGIFKKGICDKGEWIRPEWKQY